MTKWIKIYFGCLPFAQPHSGYIVTPAEQIKILFGCLPSSGVQSMLMSKEVCIVSDHYKKKQLKRTRTDATSHRMRREEETDYVRNARRCGDRLRVANKRKLETDEERQIRRDGDRLRDANKRKLETDEERQIRRDKVRLRLALKKSKETFEESLQRESANYFRHVLKRSKKYSAKLQKGTNEEERKRIARVEKLRIFDLVCARVWRRQQRKIKYEVVEVEWDKLMKQNG